MSQRPALVLEADDLADRGGHLAQAGLAVGLGGACRVHHAVVQMIGEQPDRYLLQGPGDRGDLDHHVGTVGVGVDHLLQAADLALDLAEPGQVVRLARGVPAAGPLTPGRLTVLASPAGGPDETFRIAGLTDPAITVPVGAQVSIDVINADPDTAHGMVITAAGNTSAPMPMMTARPAFPGSAVWFLGHPTAAGMHAAALTFTATTPGSYRYLCPVPGHAQKGMTGTFTVS